MIASTAPCGADMPRTLSIILTAIWVFIVVGIVAMALAAAMGSAPKWLPLSLTATAIYVAAFVRPVRR